jgi:hypothetical protein
MVADTRQVNNASDSTGTVCRSHGRRTKTTACLRQSFGLKAPFRTWKSHGSKALFQPSVAKSHIIRSWTNTQENHNGCQHAMYDTLRLLATALRPLVWHCTITIMPTATVISQMFAYDSIFAVSNVRKVSPVEMFQYSSR